ncbi:enoyl-CoA delta isomerase 1, mitochondrial-like [Actinia tenebrosa]|uniref:Enoyl-CoA delta isomerase 1, mitochondrial n=1 Tax=Actinia tenebrosa TaxID=6105 RepID=A0A6P8HPA0_ACTTE|nr:enoyl-CoA delta isomerase 1, mitochondrial-like [Actinia tenebrosa]
MATNIRHVIKPILRFSPNSSRNRITRIFARYASSSSVEVQTQDQVATVVLNRKPVNSFTLEFLEEINTTLSDLENNRDIRGLILTSSLPKVFSAGLDLIKEMHNPDPKRLAVFWRGFQEMWLQLYGSRLATIAVVNGHAIAGGCVLASACDYRIMAPNYSLGLNETVAGIAVPFWVSQTLTNLVGKRVGERATLLSEMFSSDAALSSGLVDMVVAQENLMAEAQKQMKRWLAIPDSGRSLTKHTIRREMLENMRDDREEDIKDFVSYIMRESTQKFVQIQIDNIKQKSKK